MNRQLDSKLEYYIDIKIAPKLIVPARDTNPHVLHLLALNGMVGIREQGGNNSGELVKMIQSTIGSANREPWCMSFQQAAIAYVEKKTGLVCSVPAGEHCLSVLNAAHKLHLKVSDPIVGDLMIWQYGDTDRGHVAAIVEDGDEFVRTIEGNTGPDRRVNREGDGVYAKLRSLKGSGEMKVAGFVRVEFTVRA